MSGPLLFAAAAAGALALVFRLVATAGKWLLLTAELTLAEGRADAEARRGDLTGLAESRADALRTRRSRRATAGVLALLLLALVLPLATDALEAYALAVLLWLVPPRAERSDR